MDDHEVAQLRRLLRASMAGTMGPDEEFRLRVILSSRNPEATTMRRKDLIRSGLFLLGAHEFLATVGRPRG